MATLRAELVMLAIDAGKLRVLMMKRESSPCKRGLALPGQYLWEDQFPCPSTISSPEASGSAKPRSGIKLITVSSPFSTANGLTAALARPELADCFSYWAWIALLCLRAQRL
jgi:hypothetical protein